MGRSNLLPYSLGKMHEHELETIGYLKGSLFSGNTQLIQSGMHGMKGIVLVLGYEIFPHLDGHVLGEESRVGELVADSATCVLGVMV